MATLRAEHILRSRGAGEEEELETFHDRIRETAVSQLAPKELAERHLQVAVALEASGTAEPDMLALHFRRAERPDKAVPHAIRAGDRAAEALAFDQAAAIFEYALQAAPGDAEHERTLRIKLGDALKNAGRGAQAAKEYSGAAVGAPPDKSLDLRHRAAEQLLRSGRFDEGWLALRGVLASVGVSLFESRWMAVLSLLYWQVVFRLVRLSSRFEGRRWTRNSSSHASLQLEIIWSAASALWLSESIWGAVFNLRHAALALKVHDPNHLARAHAMSIWRARDSEARRRRTERAHRAATEAGAANDPYLTALSMFCSGMANGFGGEWTQGIETLRKAEQAWLTKCSGVAFEVASTRLMLMMGRLQRGEIHQVLQMANSLSEDAERRGDLFSLTCFRVMVTVWDGIVRDNPSMARRGVEVAMSRWSQRNFGNIHLWETIALARIAIYEGESLAAHELLNERWPRVRRSLLLELQMQRVFSRDLRASTALALAAAHHLTERHVRTLLREANREADRLAREKVAWAMALATVRRAAVASLRSDPTRALSLLQSAADQFDACDMALYAAATRRRRGQLLGGDEGRALIEAADAWMAGQGIKNPARMTALFAPGFP